jgi:deazaflavin-dependent oxidoreductase (nitroreductase family)
MKLPKQIRSFNKHILNPILGRVARSAHGPFAIVKHVGRKSGKPYETTIIVFPAADGFVIALTYGPEVDWYRNVLAAGRCEVLWHKKEYLIDAIKPITLHDAEPLLHQPERTILKLVATQHFAKMKSAVSPIGQF